MSDTVEIPTRPQPDQMPPAAEPAVPQPAASVAETAEPPAASTSSWATLWLTDRDITVFTVLAAIVLVLTVARWAQLSGWGMREIEIERLTPIEHVYRLDPNEATWVELAQLDGVGEALALRIVESRETDGPFRTVDDLDRVKGIGPKTLDRLRPYLRISPAEDTQ